MKNTIILVVIIAFYGCDINNQKLLLVNSTSKSIYYEVLTDTILTDNLQIYEAPPLDSVWPNFVRGGEGAWEYKINRDSKDSTLHIFIFNSNVLSDYIISNHSYKRLDFKVEDLNKLNWRIELK